MSSPRIPQQPQVIPAGNAGRDGVDGGARGPAGFFRKRKGVFRSALALSVVALFGAGYFAGQVLPMGGAGAPGDVGDIPLAAGSSSMLPGSVGADQIGGGAGGAGDRDADRDAGRGSDRAADRASGGRDGTPATIGGDDRGDRPSGGTGNGGAGSSERDWVLQGDVVEIAGEDVLVCATGNGFGISHIGTTLREGADGEATRAEKDRLCATAFTVVGGLVLSGSGEGSMLREERDVAVGATTATCKPVENEEKVLRCVAGDDSLVTVWSVAP